MDWHPYDLRDWWRLYISKASNCPCAYFMTASPLMPLSALYINETSCLMVNTKQQKEFL